MTTILRLGDCQVVQVWVRQVRTTSRHRDRRSGPDTKQPQTSRHRPCQVQSQVVKRQSGTRALIPPRALLFDGSRGARREGFELAVAVAHGRLRKGLSTEGAGRTGPKGVCENAQ